MEEAASGAGRRDGLGQQRGRGPLRDECCAVVFDEHGFPTHKHYSLQRVERSSEAPFRTNTQGPLLLMGTGTQQRASPGPRGEGGGRGRKGGDRLRAQFEQKVLETRGAVSLGAS